MFPENEVEYEKVSEFSFTAFLKNRVEYGIVDKFCFMAFLNNCVDYGIVGKFSFIAFLITVFTKKRAKSVFLFQIYPLAC